MASAVQVSPAEDTNILGTLIKIGSPPPGNPSPLDKGLNNLVYANLDNLIREKVSTFTPVLNLPLTAVTDLAKTTFTLTAPSAPVTATTTAPSLSLKKRNNIPYLLNTADKLSE